MISELIPYQIQLKCIPTSETVVLNLFSNIHLPLHGTIWDPFNDCSHSTSSHLFWLSLQFTANLWQRLKDLAFSPWGTVTCRTLTSVQPHSWRSCSDPGVQHQWSGVCPMKTTPTNTKAKSMEGKDPSITIFFWKSPKCPMCSMSLSTLAMRAAFSCVVRTGSVRAATLWWCPRRVTFLNRQEKPWLIKKAWSFFYISCNLIKSSFIKVSMLRGLYTNMMRSSLPPFSPQQPDFSKLKTNPVFCIILFCLTQMDV